MSDYTVTRHLLKKHQEVAALAAELNASLNDQAVVAFSLLAQAIAALPPSQRETCVQAVEKGGLRHAVKMHTPEHPQGPYGTRH